MKQQSQNFTTGPIFGPLIRFALPVLAALFLQTMYGAVDLLVVGHFGTAASSLLQIILCFVYFRWTLKKQTDR